MSGNDKAVARPNTLRYFNNGIAVAIADIAAATTEIHIINSDRDAACSDFANALSANT